jgi:hypothetical protein
VRYWLNLFSVRSWEDFKANGSRITGFRANNWSRAKPDLDLIASDSQWVDSVSKSTGDSHRINYVFETWNSRLAALLDSVDGLDSERIFSIRLKKEIFAQNRTCQICGQEIKLIQDAALDHDSITGGAARQLLQTPGSPIAIAI